MKVIEAFSVNSALHTGIQTMLDYGEVLPSRNGDTLEIPTPVTTVYQYPSKKVLINPVRDANPFFHIMEAIWILAGRKDVRFLNEFNSQMVNYSDDGVEFNAPYGYRLRNGNVGMQRDQIASVISILQKDENSRQAVCQIWDENDLNKTTKDKACNMSIVFRIRGYGLEMTVYNRSNDMLWGAYGANIVQFSTIMEYVAAKLNTHLGCYYQVSNSFHVYTTGKGGELWDKMVSTHNDMYMDPYKSHVKRQVKINHNDVELLDVDLRTLFYLYDRHGLKECCFYTYYQSDYFNHLIIPMLNTFVTYKLRGSYYAAMETEAIQADDWRLAANIWLSNRVKK